MNATTRAELDLVPIPVDENGPVRACVIEREDGFHTAWAFDGGRRKEWWGPPLSAREAVRASRHLNARTSS